MGEVRRIVAGLALLVLLQVACGVPTLPGVWTTGTPEGATEIGPCAWVWATGPLPDLASEVREALDEAGIAVDNAGAVAYGENCVDANTGEIRRFAAMETDFYATVEVDDVEDREAMARSVAGVLEVLAGFSPQDTPGPQSGQIEITFVSGDEQVRLRFPYSEGMEARDRGLAGAALLEALGY
jgi:hypothetical protein